MAADRLHDENDRRKLADLRAEFSGARLDLLQAFVELLARAFVLLIRELYEETRKYVISHYASLSNERRVPAMNCRRTSIKVAARRSTEKQKHRAALRA
jgi:hypothetical protein